MARRTGITIGCTCDVESGRFAYMPRPPRIKWSNGFGIVRIDDSGFYHTEIVQAYADRFFANGRSY